MAFIENIRFYRKLGFVVYGNEYAAMPKMIISAQAVTDAIDKVIIGSPGGEWPYRGPIFGVDAKTGQRVLHRRRNAGGGKDLG
jgi:hypothetical protein